MTNAERKEEFAALSLLLASLPAHESSFSMKTSPEDNSIHDDVPVSNAPKATFKIKAHADQHRANTENRL